MREKILAALRASGHGLIPSKLFAAVPAFKIKDWVKFLENMEQEHLVFLGRADGSAGTTKGQIVMVCLRPEGY